LNSKKLYIAYGSNLHRGQMAYRCPDAKPVGTAEITGYRMIFRGSSICAVATIEPSLDHSVPVLLWEISPKDEQRLDVYEGWPRFYEKQDFSVEIGGEEVNAMAYVMTPGHELGMPSAAYLNTIMEGYRQAGFEFDPLMEALEYSEAQTAAPENAEQVNMDL